MLGLRGSCMSTAPDNRPHGRKRKPRRPVLPRRSQFSRRAAGWRCALKNVSRTFILTQYPRRMVSRFPQPPHNCGTAQAAEAQSPSAQSSNIQTVAPGGTSRANVLMSAWLITTVPVDAPYNDRTAATSCAFGTGLLALITGFMIDVGSAEL